MKKERAKAHIVMKQVKKLKQKTTHAPTLFIGLVMMGILIGLAELLSKGPKTYNEIMCKADVEGISRRTMMRAKASLNVASKKVANEWYWSLP